MNHCRASDSSRPFDTATHSETVESGSDTEGFLPSPTTVGRGHAICRPNRLDVSARKLTAQRRRPGVDLACRCLPRRLQQLLRVSPHGHPMHFEPPTDRDHALAVRAGSSDSVHLALREGCSSASPRVRDHVRLVASGILRFFSDAEFCLIPCGAKSPEPLPGVRFKSTRVHKCSESTHRLQMSRRMNDRLLGNRGFGFRAIDFLRRGFIRVPRSRAASGVVRSSLLVRFCEALGGAGLPSLGQEFGELFDLHVVESDQDAGVPVVVVGGEELLRVRCK